MQFPNTNHTNVSKFVIITLDSTNYMLGDDQLLNLIDSLGFHLFINGTIIVPPQTVLVTFPDSSVKENDNPEFILWKDQINS